VTPHAASSETRKERAHYDTIPVVFWAACQREALRGALVATAAVGLASCGVGPGFACTDDTQCRHGDLQGHCEPIGFCAYPDADCPSGARFSQYAGAPYTSECTRPTESTTSDAVESEGSDTSAANDAICGNGIVEEDEECDDGDLPSPTCNRCCRLSGFRVGEGQPAAHLESNEGHDLVMLEDGDIVIAGQHIAPGFGPDALVLRLSPSGDIRWSRSFHGPPYEPEADPHDHVDEARAIDIAPNGNLLVAGFLTPGTDVDTPARSRIWTTELDTVTGETIWEHLDDEAGAYEERARDAAHDALGGIVVAGRAGAALHGFAVRRYVPTRGGASTLTRAWADTLFDEPAGDPVAPGPSLAHALLANDDLVFAAGTLSTDGVSRRLLFAFDLETGARAPRKACIDLGQSSDDAILDLALLPDGHIAAAGFRTHAPNDRDAWVALYGPGGCDPQGQGTPVWQRNEPGPAGKDDEARGIVVDSDGNLYVVGSMNMGGSNLDIWVAKYRPMNERQWQETHDGPLSGDDLGWSLALDEAACEVSVVGRVRSLAERNDLWVGRFTQ
jgi:cysteine-rich repeat protein